MMAYTKTRTIKSSRIAHICDMCGAKIEMSHKITTFFYGHKDVKPTSYRAHHFCYDAAQDMCTGCHPRGDCTGSIVNCYREGAALRKNRIFKMDGELIFTPKQYFTFYECVEKTLAYLGDGYVGTTVDYHIRGGGCEVSVFIKTKNLDFIGINMELESFTFVNITAGVPSVAFVDRLKDMVSRAMRLSGVE